MFKKLLKSVLLASALAVPGLINAQDPVKINVDGKDLYFTLDETNHTATFVARPKEGRFMKYYEFTELTVPVKVSYNSTEYNVVLGKNALAKNTALTTLVIPEGFTDIPEGFANSCTALVSLSLPSTIKTIGVASTPFEYTIHVGAFAGTAITEIKIPDGVEALGDGTIKGCRSISNVILPKGLKVIGAYGLSGCSQLKELVLPQTMERINKWAFGECLNLTKIVLSDNISHIGAKALISTGIKEIKLPESLKVIRCETFSDTEIKSIAIPAGVERITPRGLNTNCLDSLLITDSDKVLEFDLTASSFLGRDPWEDGVQETNGSGNWIHNGISYLYMGRNISTWIHPDYEFPTRSGAEDYESLTNPFYNLINLKEITVGAGVNDASQLVFANYPELKSITFLSPEPPVLQPLTPEQAATVKVTVPEGAVDKYKAVNGWESANYFTTSGIEDITSNDSGAKTEYFNLQGVKVENPAKGLYIRKQGSRTSKVMF